MKNIPLALSAMAAHRQFILWILSDRGGKPVKLPVDYRTGSVADAHDPAIWTDSTTAVNMAAMMGDGYGVGFVLTANDPFFFVDLDNCLGDDGAWSPVAVDIMGRLPDAAIEVSQSGRGLHIIAQGAAPEHACKNIA